MPLAIFDLLLSLALGLVLIVLLTPLAIRLGLEDRPSQRKIHDGHIPLLGGIVIFLCVAGLVIALPWHPLDEPTAVFLASGALLVVVGALDDRFSLDVRLRIVIETLAATIMVFGAGLWISNLGNLVGLGQIHMPIWLGYPFTLVAVFGILNAMNMIDGMDGLAGGISLIALVILLGLVPPDAQLQGLAPLLLGGLLAFLLCNLQILPFMPKIFLGDAGSKLIGLALVWFLIVAAKNPNLEEGGLAPASALYLVGLPLFDMVATTIRRGRRGVSPFQPDRTHIHHILQGLGWPKRAVILAVLGLALAINLLGVAFSLASLPDALQFAVFFALYLIYARVTGELLARGANGHRDGEPQRPSPPPVDSGR